MCQTKFHPFIRALPKAEHHIHLEGALEPNLLFALAKKHGIELPGDDNAFKSEGSLLDRYKRFTSLDDFLHYYYIGMSVLRSSQDFEMLAWHYFQKSSGDGVKHAEVFFDPQAHLSRGIDYPTILSGFVAAKNRAQQELGMSVEIIACFLRHLSVSDSLAVFEQPDVQQSFSDRSVIGIGLDSSESNYPPRLFKEIFAKAQKLGLKRTAHVAEEGPAQNIVEALDILSVNRIDHGVRLVSDSKIMARVAQEGVMLTLCPVSNVLLRCVNTISDVPIRQYLDAGVKFSLNSDDPAYFGAYILDVYCAIQKAFDLSVDDWVTICTNSIEGSWCTDKRKEELLGHLDVVVSEWRPKLTSAN